MEEKHKHDYHHIPKGFSLFLAVVLSAGVVVFVTHPHFTPLKTVISQIHQANSFSYQGQDNKDALSLLKAKAVVGQNASGLVISINGREANATKHEYWAFYVNGKLAGVGPADYQTHKSDMILWKIATY